MAMESFDRRTGIVYIFRTVNKSPETPLDAFGRTVIVKPVVMFHVWKQLLKNRRQRMHRFLEAVIYILREFFEGFFRELIFIYSQKMIKCNVYKSSCIQPVWIMKNLLCLFYSRMRISKIIYCPVQPDPFPDL